MKRLSREAVLLAARSSFCIGILLAGAAVSAPQKWDFKVFLDDAPIGYHHYTLNDNGDERELKIEARFNVKVLFISAYRYAHDASERWRGNCLSQLTARTDDNGEKSEVSTAMRGNSFTVTTAIAAARGRELADGCLMSFAYWNPDMLRQTRLLNAQTGRIETVTTTALGEEIITVRGMPTPAKRYRVAGAKHPIDLWYGADGSWLALQSELKGGRLLRYQIN